MRTITIAGSILVSGWMVGTAIAHDPFLGLPFGTIISIPSSGDAENPAAAFAITNDDTGGAARFVTDSLTANSEATLATHTNGGNVALSATTTGSGSAAALRTVGTAGRAATLDVATEAPAPAVRVTTGGFGTGIEAISSGDGPAMNVRVDNPGSSAAALEVSTVGDGPAALFEGDVLLDGQVLRAVPVRAVVPFFGDQNEIPNGWLLCNGQTVADPDSPLNGTRVPDLRGMFVRGAPNPTSIGASGGRDQIPAHAHSFFEQGSVWFPRVSGNGWFDAYHPASRAEGFHRHVRNLQFPSDASNPYDSHGHMNGTATVSGNTRPGGAHDNRPRFTEMNFIIRIK